MFVKYYYIYSLVTLRLDNKVWRNKAILENPKADQNKLFRKYVIFQPSNSILLANDLYL